MLGKAWYHTTQTDSKGRFLYDRIILDAPATGHAISFLSLARTVAHVSPPGVLRDASERMAQMVENADETCMHVVTLAEEMPVNEGLELVTAARDRLKMVLGLGVVNRLLPPLLEAGEAEVWARLRASVDSDPMAPYVEAARYRLDREALQQDHARRFERDSGLIVRYIPEFGSRGVQRENLDEIAACLDATDAGATLDAHHVP